MKKIVTSFILAFVMTLGISMMTPNAYAHSEGVTLVQDATHSDRYLLKYNGSNFSAGNTNQSNFTLHGEDLVSQLGGSVVGFTFVFDDLPYEQKTVTHQIIGTLDTIYVAFYEDWFELEVETSSSYDFYEGFFDNSLRGQGTLYFTFEVLDNSRPAIDGQENFVTSVDDTKPISFFQNYLTAYDETDGDITDSIYIINDQYTPNRSTLGTWPVTFGVEDSAGNESTMTINITVADITKPVITGNTSTVEISYTQTWNITNFRSSLTVTDNYASMSNSDITLKSDGYTSNKTNLGTYDVVFKATDPSGNEATFTKKITVIDDIAPTFSGPTTLSKPSTSILTINEIKAQLSAQDVKDGNRTSQIQVVEDNYTGKGNIVGSYTIKFSVADTKGNVAYHTITVSVHDNIPPVWYIQDGVSIVLVPPTSLTQQQIIDLLVATGQISVQSTTQINFFMNEYQGNETDPGVYLIGFNLSDTAGNSEVHNLAITVLEGEDENPITLEPKDKNLWDHLVSFWDATVDVYETSKTWVQDNIWLASGIGIGVIVLGLVSIVFIGNKRRY